MQSQYMEKKLPLRIRLRDHVYQLFTDHLMIVLALLLIPTIFLPFLLHWGQGVDYTSGLQAEVESTPCVDNM
jgi:hypothetical protein